MGADENAELIAGLEQAIENLRIRAGYYETERDEAEHKYRAACRKMKRKQKELRDLEAEIHRDKHRTHTA